MSRIVRRPRNWLDAPWTNERIARYLTALILVGGTTFAVLKVVHLNLVFENNTPTGGDMGAHVMAPGVPPRRPAAALPTQRLEQLLVRRLPDVPVLHGGAGADDRGAERRASPTASRSSSSPILGLVTLPVCCWAFGRLARFRYPMPELMALAATVFLFDESFSIYGGNVKSTMAGEFSFSIALSFADPRPRRVRPRDGDGQVPQLGGDPARPGDAVSRHRAAVRRPRRGPAVGRVDGPHQVHLRVHSARRCRPAECVLGGAVPRQPRRT